MLRATHRAQSAQWLVTTRKQRHPLSWSASWNLTAQAKLTTMQRRACLLVALGVAVASMAVTQGRKLCATEPAKPAWLQSLPDGPYDEPYDDADDEVSKLARAVVNYRVV